jgi:hypothetical protein
MIVDLKIERTRAGIPPLLSGERSEPVWHCQVLGQFTSAVGFTWTNNRHVGQVFSPSVRTPVKTPYAAPNSVEERPSLISEGHTNFQFRPQN